MPQGDNLPRGSKGQNKMDTDISYRLYHKTHLKFNSTGISREKVKRFNSMGEFKTTKRTVLTRTEFRK